VVPTFPAALALALTSLTLLGLAGVSWSHRTHTRGARSFTFFILAAALWAGFEALQVVDPDPLRQALFLRLKFVGVALVPVGLLAFAADYTRRAPWFGRRAVVLVALVPLLTIALAWTNELHGLLWSSMAVETVAGDAGLTERLRVGRGPWFWVHAAYSYGLLVLASYYLLRAYGGTPARYRGQVVSVLVGVAVPWLANAALLLGVVPVASVDVTPLTFALSALAFARSLFSHRLLDLVPVAQETVMRGLTDAVVVAEARHRVLQVNPSAAALLGVDDPEAAIGRRTEELFRDAPELLERLGGDLPDHFDVTLPTGAGRRHFNAHLTPLADRRGRVTGHLVRLQDIERQVQAERTLRQAEITLRQQRQYVLALQEVTGGLVARRELDALLETVLGHAATILEAPHGFVDLVDPSKGVLLRSRTVGRFATLARGPVGHGEGLAGRIWSTHESMRVEEYRSWSGRHPDPAFDFLHSVIGAPLRAGDEVVGVVLLARDDADPRPFTATEEGLLERFAELGAIAVQNVRLIEEIEARRRESEQLARISTAIQEQTSLQERLDVILRAIGGVVGMERAVIWLPSSDDSALETTAWTGFAGGAGQASYRVPLDGSVPILEKVFVTGREIVVEADDPFPDELRARGAVRDLALLRSRALAALPLVSRGRTIGVLAVDNPFSRRPLTPSLETLRRFVASAAVAIDSARLYRAVQEELAERAAAQEGLRRSEEKYRSILEQIEDSYFETDRIGRFTLVNPSLCQAVQRRAEEIIGRSFRYFVAFDDVSKVMRDFAEAARSGRAVPRHELRYRRADGSEFYGETSISIIREGGEVVGFRGVVRNIEDRKRYERELEAAKEAAEAANAAKSSFLANVSHELRTPLTSILGFARLIERRLDEVVAPLLAEHEDRKVQRAVAQIGGNAQIIFRESQRLTTLINGILDLAKIEAGKVEWNMREIDPADVVRRGLEATHGLFEGRPTVRLVSEVPESLPKVTADGDRLVQVVINLISNAVKFTPAGDVTVRARAEGGRVVVSVTDTGVGIAPEDHAAVFEQFKQVGDTLTEKPQGTGLGLPICKQIVEHHGGRISIHSALGEGSTFSFDLPIEDGGTRDERAPGGERAEGDEGGRAGDDGRPEVRT
jgi:PAS domain S-box-containing protein